MIKSKIIQNYFWKYSKTYKESPNLILNINKDYFYEYEEGCCCLENQKQENL